MFLIVCVHFTCQVVINGVNPFNCRSNPGSEGFHLKQKHSRFYCLLFHFLAMYLNSDACSDNFAFITEW